MLCRAVTRVDICSKAWKSLAASTLQPPVEVITVRCRVYWRRVDEVSVFWNDRNT